MASVLQIKHRTNQSGGTGTPATLQPGELAYNEAGANAADEAAGGALYVGGELGGAGAVEVLVSNTRQVEVTGNQTVGGVKTFTGGVNVYGQPLTIGGAAGATPYVMPQVIGNADQVLMVNSNGTGVEWAPLATIARKSANIPNGGTGTIEGDFNAVVSWAGNGDQTGTTFDVARGDLWIIDWAADGNAYVWLGGTGSYGTAAGGTAAVADDFALLGASTVFATPAEVRLGTVTDHAIAPDVAAVTLLRKEVASGPQVISASLTIDNAVGETFAVNRPSSYTGNMTLGAAGAGITVNAPDATLAGTAANPLTINEAIINCGTF